jgi:phage baseplate assembly protein W
MTYLNDINDLGLMVGSYFDDAAGVFRGFITDGKTFTTIDYPGLPSGSGTFVTGLDNSGRIVGYFGPEAGLEGKRIAGMRGFLGIPVEESLTELKCSARRMSSNPGQEINAGLFVGWPLGAPGEHGRLNFSTGAQALREALWNLLMTSPGERPMRPSFGAGLRRWIGQPNTETTRALISSSIAAAIGKWEKRAVVSSVTVAPAPNDPTSAIVTVAYTQAGTPGAPPQTLTLALALGSI